MKAYKIIVLLLIGIICLAAFSAKKSSEYFDISKKDVKFINPAGFPAPVYDFEKNKVTPAGFKLGRRLFYDPLLSADGSTSCSSCHQRFAAFAHIDHSLSHGINGLSGKRNVPALQNLAWETRFMWDGGINHMEMQPIAPITSATEMGTDISSALYRLGQSNLYPQLFNDAFGTDSITTERLMKALCQFMSLMISSESKYDQYIRHETDFTEEEKSGLNLFRQNCAGCHREPLFTDLSFRNIGLHPDTALKDFGRVIITGDPRDTMSFKVPSLRNVALTYPYMHDGRFKSLEQVLNFYSQEAFANSKADELVKQNAGLDLHERTAIIAFLKTLTDKKFTYDRRFADPFAK